MNNRRFEEVPILDEDDYEDDYYDQYGNASPGGLYDAGGHLVAERWAEFADDLRDSIRERE